MKIVIDGKAVELPSSGGTSQEIYSTEEQRIGTWIDGKPLYRRVFSFSFQTIDTYFPIPGSEYVEHITKSCGFIADANLTFPGVELREANIPNAAFWCGIGYDDRVYVCITNKIFLSKPVTIFVEYTKTTDQATIELPAMLTAEQPVVIAAAQSAASAELGSTGDSLGNEEV